MVLADAEVPRGARPLPAYSWERTCPAPEGSDSGVQIGPAAAGRSDGATLAFPPPMAAVIADHSSRDAMGTTVSWGSVPFRWQGERYDTQSSLCVSSGILDAPWRTDLPCRRRPKCDTTIEVPVGAVSASNFIVMPPYVTGMELKMALEINGGRAEVLSWPLSILETPNDPRQNPGGTCPGPADGRGRCDDLLTVRRDTPNTIVLNNGVAYAASLRFAAGDHVTRDRTGLWTREQSVNLAGLVLVLEPRC